MGELRQLNEQNKVAIWAERVTECRNSGQSVLTWCKEHGICSQTYYKWQKRLFTNTPAGAQASAVIYSLIETAKENDLDPYRYLLWVLESAPAMAPEGDAWAGMLTPANAPETCKISKETQSDETNEH